MDRGTDLISHFVRDDSHAMCIAGMFFNLAHDFVFAIAPCNEIAISSNISATNGLCHRTSYGGGV